MQKKFHVKKDGKIAPCNAEEGPCPLGEEAAHYASMEEARIAADKLLEQRFNILGVINDENLNEEEFKKHVYSLNRKERVKKLEEEIEKLGGDKPTDKQRQRIRILNASLSD